MGRLLDAFKQWFDESGFAHQVVDTHLASVFELETCKVAAFVVPREEQEQVTFYVVLPVAVPADRRAAVAEAITRANYNLVIGNFELDFRDGEVRYKASIDVTGTELTRDLISPMVVASLRTVDAYFPAIEQVADAALSAEEAIARVEDR